MMYMKVLCKFSNVIIIITNYGGEDKEIEIKGGQKEKHLSIW